MTEFSRLDHEELASVIQKEFEVNFWAEEIHDRGRHPLALDIAERILKSHYYSVRLLETSVRDNMHRREGANMVLHMLDDEDDVPDKRRLKKRVFTWLEEKRRNAA